MVKKGGGKTGAFPLAKTENLFEVFKSFASFFSPTKPF